MSSPCAVRHKKKSKIASDFPLEVLAKVDSPVIPIFGSSTTSVTVPFPTNFCATSPTGAALTAVVGGTCGGPLTFSFAIACLATGSVFTISCTGPGGTAIITSPATLAAPISPTPTITISGIPIVGTDPNTVSSTDPLASQVCVRKEKCGAVLTGVISESINFAAVPANLPDAALTTLVTEILENLFAPLLTGPCGTTLLGDIAGGVGPIIACAFPGFILDDDVVSGTVADLVAAFIASIVPGVVAALRTALNGNSSFVNRPVDPFAFALSLRDPTLDNVEKCDKLRVSADVCFVKATAVPLPISSLPSSFTITVTSTCASLIPTTAPTIPILITTANLLAAISSSLAGATTLPAIFCAVTGTTCAVVSPAIVKTDKLNLTVSRDKSCICPPAPVVATSIPLCRF